MARAKWVVGTFGAPRKSGETARLAHRVHPSAPSGENLVSVRLVPDVPDQPIPRQVEHVVQRHREFHDPEAGAQMAAGPSQGSQDLAAHLGGEIRELPGIQSAHVRRSANGVEKFGAPRVRHSNQTGRSTTNRAIRCSDSAPPGREARCSVA